MLKFQLTILLMFVFYAMLAQTPAQPPASLTGTGWKGSMAVPDPTVCILKFEKDTFRILYAGTETIPVNTVQGTKDVTAKDSASIEDMAYVLHGDTLVVTKVRGGSPCDSRPGSYIVVFTGDKLKLKPINDPCDVRPYAFGEEMMRVW